MTDADFAVADLSDHLDLVANHLALRTSSDPTIELSSLRVAQSQIEGRVASSLPLRRLRAAVGLTDSETLTLVLLAGLQLDERVRKLLLMEGASLTGVRPELVRRLVHGEQRTAASVAETRGDGALRRFGLVRETRDASAGAQLAVTDFAVDVLHGRVPVALALICKNRGPVGDCDWLAGASADVDLQLTMAMDPSRSNVVAVAGLPGTGRRSAISRALTNRGRQVRVIELGRLSDDGESARETLRELALMCRIEQKTPALAGIDGAHAQVMQALSDTFAPLIDGPIVVTCGKQRPTLDWGRPVVVIEMEKPTTAELARLWHEKLGAGTPEDAQRLAEQYPLAPALIHRAAEAAKARAGERELELEDIYAGIRTVLDDKLGQYARRVEVTQRWDDIVLPVDQVDTIVELIARVRRRSKVYEQWGFGAKVGKGFGTSALFSGPPGTGKTMVAGLIARDLGLELYQVDMAKIVSKFIGETEKNLAALFDAAEAGHAVLLFDEADALFGKRTDVKSSNDRYANLETNYLLQRMETFTGIVLLTSNHEKNIDPAFQRRLSLHLRFEVPDEDERAALWKATLPSAAPVEDGVDFASLARRYAMSGGYIKNAVLRAAFLAADEDSAITDAHLEKAARVEYEGMGKIAA